MDARDRTQVLMLGQQALYQLSCHPSSQSRAMCDYFITVLVTVLLPQAASLPAQTIGHWCQSLGGNVHCFVGTAQWHIIVQ